MRLIDADALIKDIDYSADIGGALGKVVECVKYYAKFMVASAPTIERKKGKWIDMGDFEQCSVCLGTRLKEVQTVYGKAIWLKTDYCPNCGADMRGDEHEDD